MSGLGLTIVKVAIISLALGASTSAIVLLVQGDEESWVEAPMIDTPLEPVPAQLEPAIAPSIVVREPEVEPEVEAEPERERDPDPKPESDDAATKRPRPRKSAGPVLEEKKPEDPRIIEARGLARTLRSTPQDAEIARIGQRVAALARSIDDAETTRTIERCASAAGLVFDAAALEGCVRMLVEELEGR